MLKPRRRHIAAFVLAVMVLALSLVLVVSPACANPGLSVSGAMLVTDVSPGQTLTHKMKVSFGENDTARDIVVQVTGIMQSLDGVNDVLAASEDTSPYSARSFITVEKSSFHLEPGASQEVIATIQVPRDVGAGGRYAMINIATQAAGGIGVSTVAAVNVPIALTIKGSQLIHQGKITGLSAGEVTSGQPVNILTSFQNTGNHHFKVEGLVTVSDAQGKIMDTVSMPVTASSVLPGMTRQMKAAFIPKGELAVGTYTVSSRVMLEDGTLLDEASGSFEVKQVYVPPAPIGTVAALSITPTIVPEAPSVTPAVPATSSPSSTVASSLSSTATPALGTGLNWTLVVGVVAGVIIIVLLVLLIMRRGRL